MAPIKKSNYQKRTCKVNVPPILSLRKKEAFDFLVSEHHFSNPFLSPTDLESGTSSNKLLPSTSDTSLSPREGSDTNIFFVRQNCEDEYFPGKPKQYLSKVKRKRGTGFRVKRERKSVYKTYEEVLTECIRSSSTTPLKASTPLSIRRPATLSVNSPFSPIAKKTKSFRPSSMRHMLSMFENLAIKDDSSLSPNLPAVDASSIKENFYGFPGFSPSSLNISTKNVSTVKSKNECNKTPIILEQKIMESPIVYDVSNSTIEATNIETGTDKMIKEPAVKKDTGSLQVSTESSHQTEEMNNLATEIVSENVVKEIVNIEENLTIGQENEDYKRETEEKGSYNEDNSAVSPCFEKESVIIICEQESLAEDDEDKSEDVSSALSSDQEAREGVSSSDLESNSIDEEKDVGFVEMRRHSFEKISPRKSYIVGPFSRRRCLSMVPAMVSEGNENYVQSGEDETSYSFQSSKHYVTCDNFSEQNHKSSLMFCDSANDIPDDERSAGGRSPSSSPVLSAYSLYEKSTPLDPLPENLEENQEDSVESSTSTKGRRSSEPSGRRRSNRLSKDLSPSRQSPISRPSVMPDLNMVIEESDNEDGSVLGEITELDHFILPANKKYRRSLSIIRQLSKDDPSENQTSSIGVHKGRGYDQFVEHIIKLQAKGDSSKATPTRAYRKSLGIRRMSLLGQRTPPRGRRLSSVQTSPTSLRQQHHLGISASFSATMLITPCRTEFMSSPMKHPLQPVTYQPLSNLSRSSTRYSKVQQTYHKDISLLKEAEMKSDDEVIVAENYTFKDHIMVLCEQNELVGFSHILDQKSSLEEATKIGEGVYGEVFMIARQGRKNVIKIIPIEGDIVINGEKQKTFAEVYSELLVTKWLDSLRESGNEFMTVCFAELISSWIVKGKYPSKLLELWDEYDCIKGSENDRPDVFSDEQLFLVLELGNAGTDLESYSFSTAKQALSIFKQTVFAVAVAEACFEFEHRDLHWGNILISRTAERYIFFLLGGEEYKVTTNGVKSTIIDYTLSRLTWKDNIPLFNDIGQDPDMFIGSSDYQFDIYRQMKKDVGDRWEQFVPKTNVRWLHYLIDKMIKRVKYQRKAAKVHRDSMRCLHDIESWILNCDSSVVVAMRIADDYK